jgi:diaminopimelate decarboxylase
MNIVGIHMHTGSDILDIEVFLYAAEILFDAAKNFKNLRILDSEVEKFHIKKTISKPILKIR